MRRILEDWRMRRHLLTIQHALLRPTSVAGGGFKRSAHSAGPRVEEASARDVARSTKGGDRTQQEGHASTSSEK